ncbi:carbohydrate ABC transporter ATP-binding protein (CUT1 family) [Aliiruegeria haliotis]|uniref:Carbohydrate ABC transporter ATP-binding protein (CUT1 family) n=1 Tax=Aliiruegeria haliotis TaxID=1280846 RepID=A0A2T0RMV4_9RHOB|nr:ABC transporter ATP-binding protein [Aliiruegeria haliotis]PRY22467.1 carbohydrate ABC transporter ATP-binding protein (CUT1 family) [Aliiruegeria haliotis]
MATLEIVNVRKSFGAVEVLKGVDIKAEDGEFLVLVGPSGCGKSTLLNSIAGLQSNDSGEIRIDGEDVSNLHPKDRDIAMVFQTYALYPNLSVWENIAFPLESRKVAKKERRKEAERVAELLHLTDYLDRKPRQLSGGQRQRVAMGRALVRDPQVFLFDEPLSNLDAKLRVVMRTEIKKMHRTLGTTMVYVTHDQIEAMTLATKIVVLKGGEVQQVGSPDEVYNTPANMFVAGFMGSPSMNFLEGTLRQAGQEARMDIVRPDGGVVALVLPVGEALAQEFDGRKVIIGVRPEAMVDEESETKDGTYQQIDWPLEILEPTGADTIAVLQSNLEGGEEEMVARFAARTSARPGAMVQLNIDISAVVLFDPDSEKAIYHAAAPEEAGKLVHLHPARNTAG